MPTDREREVAEALGSLPPDSHVIFIDARTGRGVAERPGSGENPDACLVPIGQVSAADLRRHGISRVSIRPDNSDGSKGEPGADALDLLAPADRREARRERNRLRHHISAARGTAPGPTSAPHEADAADARPSASGQAEEAPTRPEVRVI